MTHIQKRAQILSVQLTEILQSEPICVFCIQIKKQNGGLPW